MVEPISATIMAKGLGLAGKSQGSAEVAMTSQGANLANSMVKASRVGETQKATAAEKAQVATTNRLKPRVSRRNKNSPQPKQRSLGGEVSKSSDVDWEASGAQAIASGQGLGTGQISDPWTIATSAERLDLIAVA